MCIAHLCVVETKHLCSLKLIVESLYQSQTGWLFLLLDIVHWSVVDTKILLVLQIGTVIIVIILIIGYYFYIIVQTRVHSPHQ